MKFLQNFSIKQKLLFICMLTSGLAVLMACVAFVANDFVSLKKQETAKLSILADIISHNTASALAFKDSQSATEDLAALEAEKHIDAACIYQADGNLFATYRSRNDWFKVPVPAMQRETYYFKENHLHLFRNIVLDSEIIGQVYLQFDMSGVYTLVKQRIAIGALILVSAFLMAFLLSTKLQKVISAPILHLASVAHTVSRDKNYTVRGIKQSEDELGALVDGFNGMLEQIQARDIELQNRAVDLQEANRNLEREMIERKNAEEQLLQSQKMQTVGTLAGGIAHDLNNQLTPIVGYIDLILSQTDSSSTMHILLTKANQSAKRCADVVQRLMLFTRPSTQKKTRVQIDAILEEVKSLFPNFLSSVITTYVRCQEGIWPVYGNETEIQSVIMNLLTNARDAMSVDGGTLLIEARNVNLGLGAPESKITTATKTGLNLKLGQRQGPYVVISVSDSGAGIPSHVLQRIFEPFFTTKEVGQGTGLGLSMVFNIMRDHQGWVDVSTEEGQGSVFQLYFPIHPDAISAENQERNNMPDLPRGSETILFADDEEDLRSMGRLFLEHLGYKVLLAANGEEAVRIYEEQQNNIAAVILDMTMPRLTGRQAVNKILKINPKAKIILCSGYTSEGDPANLLKQGVCDFIPKPYTISPLAISIRKALDA